MAGHAAVPQSPDRESLIKHHLHWLSGAALTGSAVFFGRHPDYGYAAVAIMLFLPLLDRGWSHPAPTLTLPLRGRESGITFQFVSWAVLLAAAVALLAWRPELAGFAAATLFFAALPEEWFFRAYFMTRLERNGPLSRPFGPPSPTRGEGTAQTGSPRSWFERHIVSSFVLRRAQHERVEGLTTNEMGPGTANLVTSLLFALMHGLTRDWITAALVFVPSLFYGWLYQRTRDIVLLVLIHALSNLIYVAFIARIMPEW